MTLLFRLTCLAVVALISMTSRSVADELPVGIWKLHAAGNWQGELVIQAVKASGTAYEVVGKAFDKPMKGIWDGTKLSFKFSDETEWYEGWLVQEKRGKKDHFTLTGVRKVATVFPVDDDVWHVAGGWYAQMARSGKKK